MTELEIPRDVLDGIYARHEESGGFIAGGILGRAATEEARKLDIIDTYTKYRENFGKMLANLGIEDPDNVDHITMYVAVQERSAFESGVKFVHDNAVVTDRGEAQRQWSVLHNMKTAGTMAVD